MPDDMTKNGAAKPLKGALPGKLLIPVLFLVATFLFISTAAVPKSIGTSFPSRSAAVATEPQHSKPAVMQWMRENSVMPDRVLSKIYDAALKSVNPDLVLAVCVVESNFNPTAESDKGAIGLMGIMPGVWLEELKSRGIVSGKNDLYVIRNNIQAGVYVLEKYLSRTNDLQKALIAYVGGDPSYPGKVLRARMDIRMARVVGERIYLAQR